MLQWFLFGTRAVYGENECSVLYSCAGALVRPYFLVLGVYIAKEKSVLHHSSGSLSCRNYLILRLYLENGNSTLYDNAEIGALSHFWLAQLSQQFRSEDIAAVRCLKHFLVILRKATVRFRHLFPLGTCRLPL
jgi:hypothetical protein